MKIAALAAGLLIAGASQAQVDPSIAGKGTTPRPCDAFRSAILNQAKTYVSTLADTFGDNSAIREQVAVQKQAVASIWIQTYLQLMRDHGCAMPRAPFLGGAYLAAAMKCRTEKLSLATNSPSLPLSCDQEKWVWGQEEDVFPKTPAKP